MANHKALIIEDDSDLAALYSHSLRYANFETQIIRDGQVALAQIEHIDAPAVIILDLHLPRVAGDEILAKIKSNRKFDKTQVIVVTADSILAKKLEDSSDLVLIKPVSLIQLRDLATRLQTVSN
jgi:DNA-binding response OmpR family regulator